MLVMCIHCSNSLSTPSGVVSILVSEPKGEGAKPSNAGVFPLFHSSLVPRAFFSMDIHCSWVFLLLYLHGMITNAMLCLSPDSHAYPLDFFMLLVSLNFHLFDF